jgi:site-specific recombinase XerD
VHDATVAPTHLATTATAYTPAQLAAFAFLARYSGATRDLYEFHLNRYFTWCDERGLDPLTGVDRVHVELYIRHLQETEHNQPSTVRNRFAAVKGFYRMASIDGVIHRNPAEYAYVPKVHRDDLKFLGLDRLELATFLAVSKRVSEKHAALAHLLGLLGLRASEACRVQIEDFAETERGYRVLRVVGKGNKPATMPITIPILRTLEAAAGDRTTGPLLTRRKDGKQLDRGTAAAMVATITRHAGITKHVTPHTLRRSAITNALDAGVPLRDVQYLARHADPRTTELYDVARNQLDRHGVHVLTGLRRRRRRGMMMIMDSPPAERDRCVWCGAVPVRDDDGHVLTWLSGDPDCQHETTRGR